MLHEHIANDRGLNFINVSKTNLKNAFLLNSKKLPFQLTGHTSKKRNLFSEKKAFKTLKNICRITLNFFPDNVEAIRDEH